MSRTICCDEKAKLRAGDKKAVIWDGEALITIKPSGNDETWVTVAHLDTKHCIASIDFNVDGKPSPPPINLTAAVWVMTHGATSKLSLEFTDPTETLAPATVPLNLWIAEL